MAIGEEISQRLIQQRQLAIMQILLIQAASNRILLKTNRQEQEQIEASEVREVKEWRREKIRKEPKKQQR